MRKICPLISIDQPANQTCPADDCAWWTSRKCCALLMLAEVADSIADHVDEIAHGDPADLAQN